MGKIYCTKCKNYKAFKKLKMSNFYDKTLLLSSICNKYGREDEKIFKEEEIIEKKNNYFKNMSQEFRLKHLDETRSYFLEEIKQDELMSRMHKKICTTLN